jgi:putative endonuclease
VSDKRVRAYRHGLFAETVAALLLRLKGHRIIARRYKTLVGEDRSRGAEGQTACLRRGEAATDFRGRRLVAAVRAGHRIVRATQYWLAGHPDYTGHNIAFDVVLATPWAWPRYIENAFPV